jgi:hypothetical protein
MQEEVSSCETIISEEEEEKKQTTTDSNPILALRFVDLRPNIANHEGPQLFFRPSTHKEGRKAPRFLLLHRIFEQYCEVSITNLLWRDLHKRLRCARNFSGHPLRRCGQRWNGELPRP